MNFYSPPKKKDDFRDSHPSSINTSPSNAGPTTEIKFGLMNDESPEINDDFVMCPVTTCVAPSTVAKPTVDPLDALKDAFNDLDNQEADEVSIAIFKCQPNGQQQAESPSNLRGMFCDELEESDQKFKLEKVEKTPSPEAHDEDNFSDEGGFCGGFKLEKVGSSSPERVQENPDGDDENEEEPDLRSYSPSLSPPVIKLGAVPFEPVVSPKLNFCLNPIEEDEEPDSPMIQLTKVEDPTEEIIPNMSELPL